MSTLLFAGWLGVMLENGSIGAKTYLTVYIVLLIVLAVGAYLLGSLNFAVIISKLKYEDDIRNHGSGNAGATNMKRTYGNRDAVFTLLGDILKAVVSVLGSRLLIGFDGACLCALACALGHAFPCWYRFKGGKCVAVTAASLLCIEPITLVIVLAIFAIIVGFTKYVSLGSVISALLAPVFLYNMINSFYGLGHGSWGIVCVFAMCLLVVALHKDNIKRLQQGKEHKLGQK